MNERLHEMMMEATKDMPQGYYVPGEYFEKFALLIVKECIQLCDQVDLVGADDCIDNIKEHFEIE